jgi:hypothetical protein
MMEKLAVTAMIFTISLAFIGCSPEIDLEAHRQALLKLNEKMRTAHLEGDAETIIAIHAYPYVKVNRGRVSHPSPEDQAERFRTYLATMNVTVWDDLVDPILTISDDASLATVIYRKRLVMRPMGQPDAEPMEGVYAWQSTYRRTSEGWRQISDVLSSLPSEAMVEELQNLKN